MSVGVARGRGHEGVPARRRVVGKVVLHQRQQVRNCGGQQGHLTLAGAASSAVKVRRGTDRHHLVRMCRHDRRTLGPLSAEWVDLRRLAGLAPMVVQSHERSSPKSTATYQQGLHGPTSRLPCVAGPSTAQGGGVLSAPDLRRLVRARHRLTTMSGRSIEHASIGRIRLDRSEPAVSDCPSSQRLVHLLDLPDHQTDVRPERHHAEALIDSRDRVLRAASDDA